MDIETVYRTYFHDVYRYLLKLSSDQNLAEELTADTFMKVIRYSNDLKTESKVKAWIFTIARNNYFNYIKKNNRLELYDNFEAFRIEENAERLLIEKEQVQLVLKILEALKAPYSEVFKLRIIEDLSFKAIGSQLNKSENWACVTYYRAKEKIKEEVKKYEK